MAVALASLKGFVPSFRIADDTPLWRTASSSSGGCLPTGLCISHSRNAATRGAPHAWPRQPTIFDKDKGQCRICPRALAWPGKGTGNRQENAGGVSRLRRSKRTAVPLRAALERVGGLCSRQKVSHALTWCGSERVVAVCLKRIRSLLLHQHAETSHSNVQDPKSNLPTETIGRWASLLKKDTH